MTKRGLSRGLGMNHGHCNWVTRHRHGLCRIDTMPAMTPESLSREVEEFLLATETAVVVEDGDIIFDLAQTKYSVSGEIHKCLLHMWSVGAERCAAGTRRRSEEGRLATARAKVGANEAY